MGWSGLNGRLDADLVHRFESQGAHTLRGTIGLRELDVRVAGLEIRPSPGGALAIDIAGVDFVAQHADITTVTLDGAHVVTRPTGPEPLPVLHGLVAAAADSGTRSQQPPRPPVPSGEARGARRTASAKPWTWAFGSYRCRTDSSA